MADKFDAERNQVAEVPEEATRPAEHESDRKLGISMLAKVAFAVVIVSALIISISSFMKANQLKKQSEEIDAQIAAYKADVRRFIYDINRNPDEAYIAEQAQKLLDRYPPDADIYYNGVND